MIALPATCGLQPQRAARTWDQIAEPEARSTRLALRDPRRPGEQPASQSTNSSSSGTFWKKMRNRSEFATWNSGGQRAAASSARGAREQHQRKGELEGEAAPRPARRTRAGCRATA